MTLLSSQRNRGILKQTGISLQEFMISNFDFFVQKRQVNFVLQSFGKKHFKFEMQKKKIKFSYKEEKTEKLTFECFLQKFVTMNCYKDKIQEGGLSIDSQETFKAD